MSPEMKPRLLAPLFVVVFPQFNFFGHEGWPECANRRIASSCARFTTTVSHSDFFVDCDMIQPRMDLSKFFRGEKGALGAQLLRSLCHASNFLDAQIPNYRFATTDSRLHAGKLFLSLFHVILRYNRKLQLHQRGSFKHTGECSIVTTNSTPSYNKLEAT